MNPSSRYLLLGMILLTHAALSQQLVLRKGIVLDSIPLRDSQAESFALYLPTNFEGANKWPVLFVFDLQGRGSQAIAMFREAAEGQGYILAASNNLRDTLTISQNIVITNRMINEVYALLPVHRERIYTAGFNSGGRLAIMVPSFIQQVNGVIAAAAAIPNTDLLSEKTPFHFIGIIGTRDFNYPILLKDIEALDKKGFRSELLVFEGGQEWPAGGDLNTALEHFTLDAMATAKAAGNASFIDKSFDRHLWAVDSLINAGNLILAHSALEDMQEIFSPFPLAHNLREKLRTLKRDRRYRAEKRAQANLLFKESLIREDYAYYLEEDILTYNLNNLGWWNYQMGELAEFENNPDAAEQDMGYRLKGYLNALIEDHIDLVMAESPQDEDALGFLWMLKTIAEPKAFSNYLKVISLSAKHEDYGTALFYLEELLEKGYTDKSGLYNLEHTALLRITPEYNGIIEKYLSDSRYDLNDE